MTNQLFRDYLEGRIVVRRRVRPGFYFLPNLPDPTAPTMKDLNAGIDLTPYVIIGRNAVYAEVIELPSWTYDLGSAPMRTYPASAQPHKDPDPRRAALAAKAARGKGPPSPGSWRGRERTTKFRSQS